ncbi:MAG: hypothetical protein ACTSVO_00630 [Candidatus Heimdallarchaeaceae archaeon]
MSQKINSIFISVVDFGSVIETVGIFYFDLPENVSREQMIDY